MAASYQHWLSLRYNQALPELQDSNRLPDPESATLAEHAADAASARSIKQRTDGFFAEFQKLRKYWAAHFDELADKLADQATDEWYTANANLWNGQLRRAGFDIKLQLTLSQRLLLRAAVQENVSLIRSIQSQYHTDVEGIVLRAFTAGRDLKTLQDELIKRAGSTQKRSALIARDQANKATAAMNSARQRELGLEWAVWIHSAAGKEPREKHVRAGREQWIFSTQRGIDFHDGFGHVLPGVAINCRCQSRTIIPAIGRGDIEGPQDLDAVAGYSGAYKAKPGKSAGPKPKQDVEKTRLPGERVRYS